MSRSVCERDLHTKSGVCVLSSDNTSAQIRQAARVRRSIPIGLQHLKAATESERLPPAFIRDDKLIIASELAAGSAAL